MCIICIINLFYRFIRDLVFRRYSRRESRAWSTSRSKVPVWTGPRLRGPVSSTGRIIDSTGRSLRQCLSYWWGKNIKLFSCIAICIPWYLGQAPIYLISRAASIQTYGNYILGKRHAGQNRDVCLSIHGRLPGTLQYMYSTCIHWLKILMAIYSECYMYM